MPNDGVVECSLLEAKRAVVALFWPGDEGECIRLGKNGVTRIHVKRVAGNVGWVPWFVVGHENGTVAMWNAAFLAGVEYSDQPLSRSTDLKT